MTRVVERIEDCSVWPTAAAAYAAAREFMNGPDAPIAPFCVRPVPLAGRLAVQLETPRGVRPCRVLGYLREDPRDLGGKAS